MEAPQSMGHARADRQSVPELREVRDGSGWGRQQLTSSEGPRPAWGIGRELGLHNKSGRRRVLPAVVRSRFASWPGLSGEGGHLVAEDGGFAGVSCGGKQADG